MSNIKDIKGITLIALVITIIVMLILSGMGIYVGTETISNIKDSKLISELEMVQHIILEQYKKYELTKDITYLVGNKINISDVNDIANKIGITLVTIPSNYKNSDYYKIDKATSQELGIKNITDEYIINYISGEVINITIEKTSKNRILYTKANNFLSE